MKGLYKPDIHRSLHLVSASFIIVVSAYYLVLIFHIRNPIISAVREGIFSPISSPILYTYLIFIALPLAMKGVYLWKGIHRNNVRGRILSVMYATVAAVAVQGVFLIAMIAGHFGANILESEYYKETRTFWAALGLALAWWGFTWPLRRYRLLEWETLKNLKGVPILSPLFCFGVPALFTTNFAPLSIPTTDKVIFTSLSVLSGFLFAAFLVFLAFHEHRVSEPPATEILVGKADRNVPAGHEIYVKRVTRIGFLIFGAATYLLTLALVDVSLAAAGAAMG
jgi:hypothetical protein